MAAPRLQVVPDPHPHVPTPPEDHLTPDVQKYLAARDLIEARRLAVLASTRLGYAGMRVAQADVSASARALTGAIAAIYDSRATNG